MDLNLKNKVFIITGGTKGIGGAITRAIAVEGGIPVFVGRNKETGEALLKELDSQGNEALYLQGDLNIKGTSEKIARLTLEKFNRIDGLINNAGRNDGVGLENGNPDDFAKSVFNNLNHYYEMAHYCLDALKKTKGSIVNISSKTALTGQGGTSGYAAAKGAQLALTREWAVELLKYHIRVNAIVPSEVMTPLYESWLSTFENPEEKIKSIVEKIPFENRMTSKEEIANTAVFLLSDKSSHTTGQQLFIDGGYVHLDRAIS